MKLKTVIIIVLVLYLLSLYNDRIDKSVSFFDYVKDLFELLFTKGKGKSNVYINLAIYAKEKGII